MPIRSLKRPKERLFTKAGKFAWLLRKAIRRHFRPTQARHRIIQKSSRSENWETQTLGA